MLIVFKHFPVQIKEVCGSVGGDVSMFGGDTSARLKSFFVFSRMQTNDYCILAYSKSARNLVSEATFTKLTFQPLMLDKRELHVICGSCENLVIMGWAVL